ncbi:MAG: glycosyltransferase family 4 protein [Bacteroidetes bacterium]|nr:glycosyltransferase family 4 protein [Bacteroidota bacterium]
MPDTLIILTPAFAVNEQENWLPAQSVFIRTLNAMYPELEVVILSFRIPQTPGLRYSWYGNSVVAFGNERRNKLNSILLWRQVWQELKRIRSRRKILGIFSFFCVECAFVGHYFARRYHLKHYIWVLGQDARETNKQVARIRPKPEELIAISDFLIREFQRSHGLRPAYMIPLGINTQLFPLKPGLRSIDILGVGSLSPIKRYDIFIEILAEIVQQNPEVHAVLCGSGSERAKLQALISKHKLERNLRLLGELHHDEVLLLMGQSKLLLHPSEYEGYGMVCAEALYAGAQVISFCQPMDLPIPHWHIVENKEQMKELALDLLRHANLEHSSVLTFEMQESVRQVLRLFGYGSESLS